MNLLSLRCSLYSWAFYTVSTSPYWILFYDFSYKSETLNINQLSQLVLNQVSSFKISYISMLLSLYMMTLERYFQVRCFSTCINMCASQDPWVARTSSLVLRQGIDGSPHEQLELIPCEQRLLNCWTIDRRRLLILLSLQSCLTLCDSIPGILQARTLEWAAISFSNT